MHGESGISDALTGVGFLACQVAEQTKLVACFGSPTPSQRGNLGYSHAGRWKSGAVLPSVNFEATRLSGALPCSTHASMAATKSIAPAPGPSRLWPTDGDVTNRAKLRTLDAPSFAFTESK